MMMMINRDCKPNVYHEIIIDNALDHIVVQEKSMEHNTSSRFVYVKDLVFTQKLSTSVS